MIFLGQTSHQSAQIGNTDVNISTTGKADTHQVKHWFGKRLAEIACIAYDTAKTLELSLIRMRFVARERLLQTKTPREQSRGA